MIFSPFSFIKSGTVGWTPANLTGVTYWFKSEAGVSLTGSSVGNWTDQISGLNTSVQAGTPPTYTATSYLASNQPTVNFLGTYASLIKNVNPSPWSTTDDFTVIVIGVPGLKGSANYSMAGGATSTGGGFELAPWSSAPSFQDQYGRYNFAGGANNVSSGINTTASVPYWYSTTYESSTGAITQFVNSSTVAQTTTGRPLNPVKSNLNIEIGGYTNTFRWMGSIMEMIFVKGKPTTSELNELNTYVNTKYKSLLVPVSGLVSWVDASDYVSGASWSDRAAGGSMTLGGTYSKDNSTLGGPSVFFNTGWGQINVGGNLNTFGTDPVTVIQIMRPSSVSNSVGSWALYGAAAGRLSNYQFSGTGVIDAWFNGNTGWALTGQNYNTAKTSFIAQRIQSGFNNTSGLTISYGDNSSVGLTHYGPGNFTLLRAGVTTYDFGTTTYVQIGTAENGSYLMPGRYATQLVYNRTLTDAEVQQVYNYYKSAYSLI